MSITFKIFIIQTIILFFTIYGGLISGKSPSLDNSIGKAIGAQLILLAMHPIYMVIMS
jgi:hypothetical protein